MSGLDFGEWKPRFWSALDSEMRADAAHDLGHIQRVLEWAEHFAALEGAKLEVLVPAAIFHDVVNLAKDDPRRPQASAMAAERTIEILRGMEYPQEFYAGIAHAIEAHSFSAGITPETIEAKVLQDADRLEAIGAIGIARCFAVSGSLGRKLFAVEDPFCGSREPDDGEYGVDHFYVKLLRLRETFQTESARGEASRRTQYMLDFLNQMKTEISPVAGEM